MTAFVEVPEPLTRCLRLLDPGVGLAVALAIVQLPADFDLPLCAFATRVADELRRLADLPEISQLDATLLRYWAGSLVTCIDFTALHDLYRISARRAGLAVGP